ncbi:hypothetical protein CTI14_64115, partial [Methylobacterium radiotolerans]
MRRIPSERWFWFDPPFHPQPIGCCCDRQPDNVWARAQAHGQESHGRIFRDRFLIAGVKMRRIPSERWFWFDPPFHPQPIGCCCDRQPDNVW